MTENMTDNIKKLISGYLDGVLSADQQAELAEWIETDPANADQFTEAVLLDNRIHAEVNAAAYENQNSGTQLPTARRYNIQLWTQLAVALAACLIVAVGVSFWLSQNKQQQLATHDLEASGETSFASIAQFVDAQFVDTQWDNGNELNIGDRLSAQKIKLRSGYLRLAFDDGVEVTLQGPAEYELLAAGKTKLTSGLLTAIVPPGAEGFTVDTPTAEVVDLGTAFGIDLQKDGVSRVSVFEGEVEVSSTDSAETKRLKEGDAAEVTSGESIKSVEFDPEPFTKIWPVASGIESSEGDFQFLPPWPRRIRFVRSDTTIFVQPEGHRVHLSQPLAVNISQPGEYSKEEQLTSSELAAGSSVRSFVLHYHPEEETRRRKTEVITGSITFDRPVIGLIVLQEELLASREQLSLRNLGESHPRRQLELSGGPLGDNVSLSPDRRIVKLSLASPRKSSDLLRIIVDGTNDDDD